jgi:hypothetical protein
MPQPQHPSAAETPYRPKQWLTNPAFCSMVGQSMSHLLKILGLSLGLSKTEIKVDYRQFACKYHPDKNDSTTTDLTAEEAQSSSNCSIFKLLNKANDYQKE